jgi:hypothetical protein
MGQGDRGGLIEKLPKGACYSLGLITGLILGIFTGIAMENIPIGFALGPSMGFMLGLALESASKHPLPLPTQEQKVVTKLAIAGVIILSIIVLLSISLAFMVA